MKILLPFLAALLLASCGSSDRTFISIGTGGQTGVYYPVGGAIKKLVEDVPGTSLNVSVATSNGSVQNINDLLNGAIDFGMTQADRQYQAVHGQANWEGRPREDLRFVFSLHPEVVTLIAAVDSGIDSVQDLKGKRVNLGSPGSGQRGNALQVLKAAGINPDADLEAGSLGVGECAGKLQDGRIDAYFYTVGHPNGSITEATTGRRKVRFIPIEGMEALIADAPYYSETRVPVDYYEQAVNEAPVPTIGMLTTLVTRADVPEDTVYTLVKAVFENLGDLKIQHAALQALSPSDMLRGAHAPIHPGSERYFREAGLLDPSP